MREGSRLNIWTLVGAACMLASCGRELNDAGFNQALVTWDSLYERHPSQEGNARLTKLLEEALENKDSRAAANVYRRFGNQWVNMGELKTGMDMLLKSMEYSRKADDMQGFFSTLNNIGRIYDREGQDSIGKGYHLTALKEYVKMKNYYGCADMSYELAKSYLNLQQQDSSYPDSALYYARESMRYKNLCMDNQNDRANYQALTARIFLKLKQPDSARYWLDQARQQTQPGNYFNLSLLALTEAEIHSAADRNKAGFYLSKAGNYADKVVDVHERANLFRGISNMWSTVQLYDSGFYYFKRFFDIQYAVLGKENLFALGALERIYNMELMEKRHRIIWTSLSAGIGLVLLVVFFFYRNQYNKRRKVEAETNLYINKILEEVNQTKMEAWADGQQKERSRLAGELHDRLGGLLVMASNHFNSIEKKFDDIIKENETAFSDFRKIINTAIIEVRELSRDISSNIVNKLGLGNALMDLKDKVGAATGLRISLDIFNTEAKVSLKQEIALFRIAQEALNNIMKHAQASEVHLSLTGTESSLVMIVEDNGKGFDPAGIMNLSGIGLKSMQNRMQEIGGTLNIDSRPGRGTIIIAEVSIK